jgi:hypothetical protein
MLFYERITPAQLRARQEREAACPPIEVLISSPPVSEDEGGTEDSAAEQEQEAVSDPESESVPSRPQQLLTPPSSDSEHEEASASDAEESVTPILQQTQQATPPPEGPVDVTSDDEDVPELARDVSSRDSSPETPPPSVKMTPGRKKSKAKRKGRVRGTAGVHD